MSLLGSKSVGLAHQCNWKGSSRLWTLAKSKSVLTPATLNTFNIPLMSSSFCTLVRHLCLRVSDQPLTMFPIFGDFQTLLSPPQCLNALTFMPCRNTTPSPPYLCDFIITALNILQKLSTVIIANN